MSVSTYSGERVNTKTCKLDSCNRVHYALEYCRPHWRRLKTKGDPQESKPFRADARVAICSIEECAQQARTKLYCWAHFRRLQRTGKFAIEYSNGYIDEKGYKIVTVGGRKVREHRFVMEQQIGRGLYADEQVHHINGERADNRIENLELWSVSQPAGQRVEDKLAWAYEIIKRYGGQPLTPFPLAEALQMEGLEYDDNSDQACASGVCGI